MKAVGKADGALLVVFDAYAEPALLERTIGSEHGPSALVAPLVDPHSMLNPDLKVWLGMNRRQVLQFLTVAGTLPAASVLASLQEDLQARVVRGLSVKVDTATIEGIENLADAVGCQYEALGPHAVRTIREGQADLVQALLPNCPAPLRPRLKSVQAGIARTLGWMSYDAGDFEDARTHYDTAHKAAVETRDDRMLALVLCNMSLCETRDDNPVIGVNHAVSAAYWATRDRDRLLLAYARDMAAEAHAQRGETRECLAALDESATLIAARPEPTLPTYVYDAGLSAGFRAEALTILGDADRALDAARHCVDLLDPAFGLSHGFARVGHGAALRLAGEIDEAATVLTRAAHDAVAYGSPRLHGEVVAELDCLITAAPSAASVRRLEMELSDCGLT
ncbi:hypothetical protein [Nocardia yamanashiensis]|uniref:hypothetical protein n=1 Tax=Nocardia yamanashiensis TaxID=209247 RepID=UPI000AD44068|nr:hypothetical protein [Nocardia yamanashiensis]